MGRGSYTASDWLSLRSNLSESKKAEEIFANKLTSDANHTDSGNKFAEGCKKIRESLDSEDSPEATPVIIGFDVTASMGYLAKELALNSMNGILTHLFSQKPISNPHVLCAAIGDSKADRFPLQVTQFEADIRVIKQLVELYLEGGGGGNGGESYNLLWYFASRHTKADCFTKRKKKGYLFTIGDDASLGSLSQSEIKRVFNDNVSYILSDEELLREAEKNYNVYHILIENGSSNDEVIFNGWKELMPGKVTVINKKEINLLADLIYAVISVGEGNTPNETLKSMDQFTAEKIARSLAYIDPPKKKKTIVF